jgi:hypothetical protein
VDIDVTELRTPPAPRLPRIIATFIPSSSTGTGSAASTVSNQPGMDNQLFHPHAIVAMQ